MVDKIELHGGQNQTACTCVASQIGTCTNLTHIPSACFYIIIVVLAVKCMGNSYTVKPNCKASLVPTPRAPPGEKRSGERSRISWAYSPKRWKTNEIARSLIIT